MRPDRSAKYSMSVAYMYPSLLYAIPPGRPYTSLEKLYFPFKIILWSSICALFIIGALVVTILKLLPKHRRDFVIGTSNDMPLFNMVSVSLGGSLTIEHIPVKNFARTILMIWLIATLVLRNSYQGKLFDNMRSNQRMAPLFTLNDLYESHLKIHIFTSYYQNIVDSYPHHSHR